MFNKNLIVTTLLLATLFVFSGFAAPGISYAQTQDNHNYNHFWQVFADSYRAKQLQERLKEIERLKKIRIVIPTRAPKPTTTTPTPTNNPTPTATPTATPTGTITPTPTPATGFTRPLITVTFDDARVSQYTAAWPILQKYGYKGTFYITTGGLGGTPFGEEVTMTADNVVALHNGGNDIEAHAVTHPDLTTLTPDQIDTELSNSKTYLQNLIGAPVDHFALPFGATNDTVQTEIAKYFRTSRLFFPDATNTKSNTNLLKVSTVGVRNTTSDQTIQSWIDQAKSENSWVIFTYHSIRTSATNDEYSVSPAQFEAQIQKIQASGVPVVTVKQAVDEIAPQLAN